MDDGPAGRQYHSYKKTMQIILPVIQAAGISSILSLPG